jgi:translocation and assembly module TamA
LKSILEKIILSVSLLISSGMIFGACATPPKIICRDRIHFTNLKDIKFSPNENLFLCGDDTKESWKEIPFSQIEYNLRNFLADRAYYEPTFTFKNDQLTVDPGNKRLAAEIKYEGAPDFFFDVTLRDVLQSPMNSALLDNIEGWTKQRLRKLGYACPIVKSSAFIDKNLIVVKIEAGPQYVFTDPELKDPLTLFPWAYTRFNAFVPGTTYQSEWVQLSQNRAENDGIVVSSQITNQCPQPGPELKMEQKLLGGDPRLLTIGAGASTEEFPIAEIAYKSVRMDLGGSNLNVITHASQRIQRINSFYTYYAFKNYPRLSLSPTVSFVHDVENTATTSEFQFGVPLAYAGDWKDSAYVGSLGPAFDRIFSVQNGTTPAFSFLSLIGNFGITSHDYELYVNDPRSGYTRNLNVEVLSPGFSVNPIATIVNFSGSELFQINSVYPPQFILGFRYSARTTLTKQVPVTNPTIPAKYFETLGGDQDMRGFGRQELTAGTPVGGLTAVYLGTEFRYAKSLPYGIEPFGFFDAAKMGQRRAEFDPAFYYSPGVGIRLATPFGSIRSTLAHGYVLPSPPLGSQIEHYQFFISFGKEF